MLNGAVCACRGTGIFEDVAVAARQQVLHGELAELGRAERALDQVLQECSLQLRRLTDDGANQRYPFARGDGAGGLGYPSEFLSMQFGNS